VPASLHVIAGDDPELLTKLTEAAEAAGLRPTLPVRLRTVPPAAEIILAIGSAGAFTALYQIIGSLLKKNENRELTLKLGDVELTLKGHTLPEEEALLERLAPELLAERRTQGSRNS
jgi:hypothetical protein